MVQTLYITVAASFLSSLTVSAAPARANLFSVPLFKRVGNITAEGFLNREKARMASLSFAATTGNAPAINEDISYVVRTVVGTQTFYLIVDTGSSNTWVGAETKYVKSSTGTSLSKNVSVSYGSGSFSGTEYTDTVTLGGLAVVKQSIGVASKTAGFSRVDGILGVGPVDLTRGTVTDTNLVPTVLNNLYSQVHHPLRLASSLVVNAS